MVKWLARLILFAPGVGGLLLASYFNVAPEYQFAAGFICGAIMVGLVIATYEIRNG